MQKRAGPTITPSAKFTFEAGTAITTLPTVVLTTRASQRRAATMSAHCAGEKSPFPRHVNECPGLGPAAAGLRPHTNLPALVDKRLFRSRNRTWPESSHCAAVGRCSLRVAFSGTPPSTIVLFVILCAAPLLRRRERGEEDRGCAGGSQGELLRKRESHISTRSTRSEE
jgi:hypothetical protein